MIKESKKSFFKDTHRLGWYVSCDRCGKENNKMGRDAGDAAEWARKEGFATVLITATAPLIWKCPVCRAANGKRS